MMYTAEQRAYRKDVNKGLRLAKECLIGAGHVDGKKDRDCFCCYPNRMQELLVWAGDHSVFEYEPPPGLRTLRTLILEAGEAR